VSDERILREKAPGSDQDGKAAGTKTGPQTRRSWDWKHLYGMWRVRNADSNGVRDRVQPWWLDAPLGKVPVPVTNLIRGRAGPLNGVNV